jgi:hypothetical protein
MSQRSKKWGKEETVFKQNELENIIALILMKREEEIKWRAVRK